MFLKVQVSAYQPVEEVSFMREKSSTSRRKNENKRKVRKTKEKRLEQRARHLLGNLTSIEVTGQICGSVEENDRVTPVDSINADFAKKLTRRLHLNPLL